jgi:hypothetical protein
MLISCLGMTSCCGDTGRSHSWQLSALEERYSTTFSELFTSPCWSPTAAPRRSKAFPANGFVLQTRPLQCLFCVVRAAGGTGKVTRKRRTMQPYVLGNGSDWCKKTIALVPVKESLNFQTRLMYWHVAKKQIKLLGNAGMKTLGLVWQQSFSKLK